MAFLHSTDSYPIAFRPCETECGFAQCLFPPLLPRGGEGKCSCDCRALPCFHRDVCHGDFMVTASCLTTRIAQWGQEEKQQKNGLCTELLGRRWWSLSWSFRLFWTRLSEESFSPENHIYSSSRDALSLLCQCVALRSCLFISLGTHRLWKADTENRGLSWCHRCKWDSLPVPTLNCWEKSVVVRKINLWKDIFCLTWTNLKVHFQEIQACA